MADIKARIPLDLFEIPTDLDAFAQAKRIVEAMLFQAAEPLDDARLASKIPDGVDVIDVLEQLIHEYAARGVQLRRIAGRWTFRTADDLAPLLRDETLERKRLSRAQLETLSIIAYHQPVTRAEIEEIRGVATARGTLDVLLETGWVRLRGRRRTPGRPVTYGTTSDFLIHFGLDRVADLPGLDELKGAGLFDGRLPPGVAIPMPSDDPALGPDEDPLEPEDLLGPPLQAEDEAPPETGTGETKA